MTRDPEFNYNGVELISPILRPTEACFAEIAKVVETVQRRFCMIANHSTGLHIHVGNADERGLGVRVTRNFSLFVTAFEPLIHTLLAEHRTALGEYHYCVPPSQTNELNWLDNPFERLSQLNAATSINATMDMMNPGHNRFCAYNFLNLQSPKFKRTIEFRQSQGSVDPEYIRIWATLCIGIIDFCSEASEVQLLHLILSRCQDANFGPLSLLRMIGKKDLIEYFSSRLHVSDRNVVQEGAWELGGDSEGMFGSYDI